MNIQVYTKVLIVRPDGCILVLKRDLNDERRAGEWDFPGGGVELGENASEGAVREVMEEVGISVTSGELKLFYAETEAYLPRNDSNTRIMFITNIDTARADTVVLSHEHEEYKWEQPSITSKQFPHPVYSRGLQYALEHDLLA